MMREQKINPALDEIQRLTAEMKMTPSEAAGSTANLQIAHGDTTVSLPVSGPDQQTTNYIWMAVAGAGIALGAILLGKNLFDSK